VIWCNNNPLYLQRVEVEEVRQRKKERKKERKTERKKERKKETN
jgi:hypothetical protein